MSRPGVEVSIVDRAPGIGALVDSGLAFFVGQSEKGTDARAVEVHSLSSFEAAFGARVSYGALWDAADVFFREGGTRLMVGRVTGPAALPATLTLQDATNAASVKCDASSPGAWGGSQKVAVIAGQVAGTVYIAVTDAVTNAVLESSPETNVKADLLSWGAVATYVRLSDADPTKGLPKALAATVLAGGTDDRANIVDADWKAALDLFTSEQGPGQVAAPGQTSAARHAQLLAHAQAQNRIALLDPADTNVKANLIAIAGTDRALGSQARYGAIFAPWIVYPGIAAGTVRVLPYSPLQAGLMARTRAGVPAAGERGVSRYAMDVRATFTDADYEDLNEAGCDMARVILGAVWTYGYRSLADPVKDPQWIQLNGTRVVNEIKAKADAICQAYVFDLIDGQGHTIAGFNGDLVGMLLPYFNRDELYGSRPDEAFRVDTGPTVNTIETIADGQLKAIMYLKTSPFAELVVLEIVKVALTEVLS